VRRIGMRQRDLHGHLHAEQYAVLEQRRPDVQRRGAVERRGELRESGLCGGCVHGRMCAG
jgi:hypothetical protein